MHSLRLLRNVEARQYQETIFKESLRQNTLVVLPTGLGKTVIIAYLVAYYLQHHSRGLILIGTPTKPLVHQTVNRLHEFVECPSDSIVGVSGSISPSKRALLYETARIIVGTPQTLNNDLLSGRIDPNSVIFLALDEVHRATGNYAYVGIVQQLPSRVHIVGFTATPGNTKEQVLEVIQNIRAEHVVVRDDFDPDVRPYVSLHHPERIFVDLPTEYRQALSLLRQYHEDLIKTMEALIAEHDLDDSSIQPLLKMDGGGGRRHALDLHHHVINLMRDQPEWGSLLTSTANLLRVAHLQDLIETQGLPQANAWMQLQKKKSQSKALQEFFEHPNIIKLLQILKEQSTPHPKLNRLKSLIDEHLILDESKIIVFSNYRDTVEFLHAELQKWGYNVAKFIGQSARNDRKGMSQKEQVRILEEFQNGSINILISTSVGEEGLDVGNCDLVVFYDSVPSVIRSIQRKGRGRKRRSRVVHLIAKGTRDVGMYYSTKSKNKKIKLFLKVELPRLLKSKNTKQNRKQLDKWLKSSNTMLTENHDSNLFADMEKLTTAKSSPASDQLKTSESTTSSQLEKNTTLIKAKQGKHAVKPKDESELSNQGKKVSVSQSSSINEKNETEIFQSNSSTFMIVVDSRESASVVPRLLKRRGIEISMKTLPVADYLIPPSVLVERKSYDDFVSSIHDGRLFSQAVEMTKQENIEYCFLILEENRSTGTSLRMEAEHGAILSLLLDFGMAVIISHTPAETVDYLISLAKRFQTDRPKRLTLPLRSTSGLSLREIRELMLMQITGINKTKARSIMDYFQTLDAIFAASIEDLQQVEGIGKVLARRIYEVLHAPDIMSSQEK